MKRIKSPILFFASLIMLIATLAGAYELNQRATKKRAAGISIPGDPQTGTIAEDTLRFASVEWPGKIEAGQSDCIKISFFPLDDLGQFPPAEMENHEVANATQIPVGTPNAPLADAFGPNYKGTAKAKLEATTFEIRPLQPDDQSLLQESITWDWNIRPLETGHHIVNARLFVQWQPTNSEEEIIEVTIWRSPLEITVVDKYLVETPSLVTFIVIVSLLGTVFLVLSFVVSVSTIVVSTSMKSKLQKLFGRLFPKLMASDSATKSKQKLQYQKYISRVLTNSFNDEGIDQLLAELLVYVKKTHSPEPSEKKTDFLLNLEALLKEDDFLTKDQKIDALIRNCNFGGYFSELVEVGRLLRPDIFWDEMLISNLRWILARNFSKADLEITWRKLEIDDKNLPDRKKGMISGLVKHLDTPANLYNFMTVVTKSHSDVAWSAGWVKQRQTSAPASGIPASLNEQLRRILLNCGPFDDASRVKAVFVDSRINHWQDQLPEANSTEDRVQKAISFLVTRHNKDQENALVLFLKVLSGRTSPEDACRQDLANLASDLESHLPESKS